MNEVSKKHFIFIYHGFIDSSVWAAKLSQSFFYTFHSVGGESFLLCCQSRFVKFLTCNQGHNTYVLLNRHLIEQVYKTFKLNFEDAA